MVTWDRFGIIGPNFDVDCKRGLGFDVFDSASSVCLGANFVGIVFPSDDDDVESRSLLVILDCFGFCNWSKTL